MAPGQGLGISIAGGKGSTPLRGDDEVRLQSTGGGGLGIISPRGEGVHSIQGGR